MNRILVTIAGLLFIFVSCKPNEDPEPSLMVLQVTPRHHGRAIDSCMIYIKHNAVDPPLDGKYDDSAQCQQVGGIPVATFMGIEKGNHYVYGYGWDPALTPPQAVKGGFAYYMSADPAPQSFDLAVSED